MALLPAVVVAAASLVALGIPGCTWVEQDRCLDGGGMWNEGEGRCEYEWTRENCRERGGRFTPSPPRCGFARDWTRETCEEAGGRYRLAPARCAFPRGDSPDSNP